MTRVADIMSTTLQVVRAQDTLQHAARYMKQLNVGSLPVCEGTQLLGIVTDRDITVRGTAQGLNPAEARVSDVMTRGVETCAADDDAETALQVMGRAQVRRLPVVDAKRNLVGLVSLGDLSTHQARGTDEALREISTPSAAQ